MSNDESLGEIIKREREKRGLLLRHVGAELDVDQALISKFEHGDRMPTKEQVEQLSSFLDLDKNELMTAWLADKIIIGLKNEKMALRAMKIAEHRMKQAK